jgi:hypothetical protein
MMKDVAEGVKPQKKPGWRAPGAVLAVVVSFGNPVLTLNAVNALVRQRGVNIRIVVWDNFYADDTRDTLATKLPIRVTLHCSPNILWSPAINAAVKQHWDGEDFLLFQNNDLTLPAPNGVRTLKSVFELYPDAGIVAPMTPALGGPQDPLQCTDRSKPIRTAFVLGACTMVPYKVWTEVGPLDPEMPLGADDHDYCIRVKHAGYSIWVDPRVGAGHKGHASGFSDTWEKYGGQSWARFNEKWGGYYATDEEACRAHWDGIYVPGFEKGTGWTEAKYKERTN